MQDAGADSVADGALIFAEDVTDAVAETVFADSAWDGGDSFVPSDSASSTCEQGTQEPSRQTVRLVVTNQTTTDRFLVDRGWECDAFRIASPGGSPLPLQLTTQCPCECPSPGPAGPSSVERLSPGASFTLTWDARSISTCAETVDCAAQGWPNTPPGSALVASAAPVPAGTYVATVVAFKALPMSCSGSGPMISCAVGAGRRLRHSRWARSRSARRT
ncbi:MAG TPA: hypothetical protein VKU41_28590 [Polyangiaceae bacterium]|nr:hypothetical protein [Polyangiaceae bacterium]